MKALLDTGAGTNMIRKSVVEDAGMQVLECIRIMKGIGEQEIQTEGFIKLPVRMFGIDMGVVPFYVVGDKNIKVPIILSQKFCIKSGLVIDMSCRRVRKCCKDGSKVDVYLNEDEAIVNCIHEKVKVFVAEDVTIKRGLNKIPVRIDTANNRINQHPEKSLLFDGRFIAKELESISGVLNVESEENFIFVNESTAKEGGRTIKSGKVIGCV